MLNPQLILGIAPELVIDLFAGGGGASTGIEQAIGRHVDIAINHDPEAVALHQANHPQTRHFVSDVFEVDPAIVTAGQPVGLLWASPDCKHFSKAKGGKPCSKKIRSLAWVVVKWAKAVQPRVICLENVEEFQTWGPLGADNMPCPRRKGDTFKRWKRSLESLGYTVEHRELRACDYGAPTIRKRLFLVARRDGAPIVWPEPTHGAPGTLPVRQRKLKAWRTAAECIDWSIPCPSIFERSKPLADATCRRIAKGIMRYVVEAKEPFIVRGETRPLHNAPPKHGGDRHADQGPIHRRPAGWTDKDGSRCQHDSSSDCGRHPDGVPTAPADQASGRGAASVYLRAKWLDARENQYSPAGEVSEPQPTQPKQLGAQRAASAAQRSNFAAATLVQTGYGEREGQAPRALDLQAPLGTIVATQKHALVAAFLSKFRTNSVGSACDAPVHTVTAGGETARPSTGNVMALVAANMIHLGHGEGKDGTKRFSHGIRSATEPINTIAASGAPGALVQSFLVKYYGSEVDGVPMAEPMHTIPTRDRFGLVTVHGEQYAIVDIGLRMLSPRELYRAQGFPESYAIDHRADGKPLTKTAQVRMCGNSVCPPLSRAIVAANYAEPGLLRAAA